MTYYGIAWRYGVASDEGGGRFGDYYRFHTRAARDAWVQETIGLSTGSPGVRSAIDSDDYELRALLRRSENNVFDWEESK